MADTGKLVELMRDIEARQAQLQAEELAAMRQLGRREGAEKALFYAACALEQLAGRDPLPGETPAEWMGAYKALIEAQLHVLAAQIDAGRLNLRPLPAETQP